MRDRRILLELDFNARDSDAAIAKRVGLSKESASYRIRRMLSNGTIKSFHAILDTTQLGLRSFRILLRLQGITPKEEEEFRSYLVSSSKVFWIVSTYGIWQYNLIVTVRDSPEFAGFWRDLYDRFGAFIEARQISEVIGITNFRRDYLVPGTERAKPLVWGKFGRADHDGTDMRILSLISKDARMASLQIGKRIGVSHNTVRSRIGKLERNGVILGYRSTLDLGRTGYSYYKVHMNLQRVEGSSVKALRSLFAANPSVFAFDDCIGGYDMEVEAEAQRDTDVLDMIGAAKARFPELIRSYEILRYLETYKVDYLPRSFRA